MDIGNSGREPAKSSLSKFRSKISFKFFQDRFYDFLNKNKDLRKRIRGFYVYAVDGKECTIPLSEKLLKQGYRGRAQKHNDETFYPRMYLSQVFDVVNELTTAIVHSNVRNENKQALELVNYVEPNSICMYDRAYFSRKLIEAHKENKSYFIIRCRRGATAREITTFSNGSKKESLWIFNGVKIRLIKLKNPRTGEVIIFATNLSRENFNNKEIGMLYCRRWAIETSFKDSVNQGFDQWHAKTENGILQELFCHYWLMNLARFQVLAEQEDSEDWLERREYKKSNLKLLVELMVDCIPLLLKKLFRKVQQYVRIHIRRTTQRRKRLSRNFPRIKKYSTRGSIWARTVPLRPR